MQHNSSNITGFSLKDQMGSAVLGICFLLGIPGNILVVVVILQHFKRKNFTLHLMLNLAVSDIVCLLTAPLVMYDLLAGWYIGKALCKILFFVIYLCSYVSLLTVTLISVHRYVFVLHPNKWAKLGQRGEKALLLILWITAGLSSLFTFYSHCVQSDGSRQICWRDHTLDGYMVAKLLSEIVMAFIIPLSIIVTSYWCLHKKVNQTAFFSNQRLTKLLTSIVVTFLILWTPCQFFSLLEIFAFSIKSHNEPLFENIRNLQKVCRPVVNSLVFLNNCVNPLLYAFNYHSFRQTVEEHAMG